MPDVKGSPLSGLWYSFNYGLGHFVFMSTEHNFTVGSPQARAILPSCCRSLMRESDLMRARARTHTTHNTPLSTILNACSGTGLWRTWRR